MPTTSMSRCILLVPALLIACGGATAHATQRIVITGSSTIAPVMAEIAARYENLHPGVRIDVQTGGSSRGIADVRRGLADIGMVSRALSAAENDLHGHPLALDGIAMIVHRDNPVATLDKQQVVAIYTGKIRNWRQCGGADAPITVVHKAEGRSTLELFLQFFGVLNPEVRPSVVIGDNQQGIKTVAANPDAVGYVSIGSAEQSLAEGEAIRLLPLDGIAATTAMVRSRRFPLTRTLHLVTASPPTGVAKDLIEFARSAAVHDLLTSQALVPLEN